MRHNRCLQIALRPATADDFEFARKAHHEALGPHIERLFGWDADYQAARCRSCFSPDGASVLLMKGEQIGWLKVLEDDDRIYLSQLFILPRFQNRGVGSTVLTQLTGAWRTKAKPVRLGVFKDNPARRLYERFGFVVESEEETRYVMRWSPDRISNVDTI